MLLPFIVGSAEMHDPRARSRTAGIPATLRMRGLFHTPEDVVLNIILLCITNSVAWSASSFAMWLRKRSVHVDVAYHVTKVEQWDRNA